jgi:dihydroorotate dehydrogenase
MNYYNLLKPFIYKFSPEAAHNMAVTALKTGVLPSSKSPSDYLLKVKLFDLEFPNPVGMAAGFDKNADAIRGLLSQGFGFVEVGTVTPRPQAGNPKPRLFRLEEDEAVINRMGFNNKGANYFVKNLKSRPKNGIVGANIGKNKDSESAAADYLFLLEKVYPYCDYVTINISSPNTPGLRDLQEKNELDDFLGKILKTKEALVKQHKKNLPLLIKLAPDTSVQQREDIAQVLLKHKIDGMIISNTTIGQRDLLQNHHLNEAGGLSGKPLFDASTKMVAQMYKLTYGKIPIIGVGGISSAEDAYAKIKAGASLVQVYSALVFQGFDLVSQINEGLLRLLKADGFKNISEAVGSG